jgi:hypothetical protein
MTSSSAPLLAEGGTGKVSGEEEDDSGLRAFQQIPPKEEKAMYQGPLSNRMKDPQPPSLKRISVTNNVWDGIRLFSDLPHILSLRCKTVLLSEDLEGWKFYSMNSGTQSGLKRKNRISKFASNEKISTLITDQDFRELSYNYSLGDKCFYFYVDA